MRLRKLALSFVTLLMALMPTWVCVFLYHIAGPAGFWQKFAVLGAGTVVLGSLQVGLLLFWVVCVVVILS